MDLQEEYFLRKTVPAKLIKYVERANVILKARNSTESDNWLNIHLSLKQENNHPSCYHFTSYANPVIYVNSDFSNFSYQHNKLIDDKKIEWDQYETFINQWIDSMAKKYVAISSQEAIFASWEMFLCNYDYWFASFLPYRIIDILAESLESETNESKLSSIRMVEDWIKEKHQRVFECWKNIKQQLDSKNYADWLVEAFNK